MYVHQNQYGKLYPITHSQTIVCSYKYDMTYWQSWHSSCTSCSIDAINTWATSHAHITLNTEKEYTQFCVTGELEMDNSV